MLPLNFINNWKNSYGASLRIDDNNTLQTSIYSIIQIYMFFLKITFLSSNTLMTLFLPYIDARLPFRAPFASPQRFYHRFTPQP